MVHAMREYGGSFVSLLADAMIAADPINYSRLCDAFPEIVSKYSEDGSVPYTWLDLRRINLISDGMPEAKHCDGAGRVWWGAPVRNDEETGELYQASWDLRDEPFHGATCWMSAADLAAPVWADDEGTFKVED